MLVLLVRSLSQFNSIILYPGRQLYGEYHSYSTVPSVGWGGEVKALKRGTSFGGLPRPLSAPEDSVGKLPSLADERAGDAQGSCVADWSTLAGAESLPLNLLFELARTAFIP